MKKLLVILILLIVADGATAQFRKGNRNKNSNSSTQNSNEVNYSNPQEYEIASIEVVGLNVLDKNALVSLTGLKVGDKVKIPGDDISLAIRKLWKHGLVGDVSILIDKIEGSKVYLKIELSERPRLTGFAFEGISKAQEGDLREELNLIRGRVLSDAIVRNTEITVKKYFVAKGFLNVDVKVIQSKDDVNRDGIKLKIVVDKNSKVKINKVSFEGNENINDAKLKK
ncbi:MAG: POTRA domain-containing protein, partial [Bacteroidota bacterium]